MQSKIKEHWMKLLVFILSLVVIYFATLSKTNTHTQSKIESSFKQALGVFATTKALNGVISLAQGTEIGPPGITISIGEILDPINDLVERFSWIMLASLTSLGIQKILMNMTSFAAFEFLLILSLVVSNLLYFIKLKKYEQHKKVFFRFTILLVFIRFSMPFMVMSNEYVYENFVQQDYNIEFSKNAINSAKADIQKVNEKKAGYFSTDFYKRKITEFQKLSSDTADHIVDLIIVFIFQTMLFPLVFLFVLYKIVLKVSTY